MEVTVKYFGLIAEVTNKKEETFDVSGTQISDVLEVLNNTYNQLKNKDYKIAQNQEIVTLDTKITGAEIALLPPFSGG